MLLMNGRCRSVDEYEKVKIICSGSFGSVYKVRERRNSNLFALKRMNPSMCHDTNGFSVLYIREIMVLKHLNHKNIIRIEEVVEGEEINDFFIVMEYCDIDLKSFIQKTDVIDTRIIRYVVYEVVEGLRFLHENGVIHRDLKPSNILMKRNGELKIADFGLARTINDHMTNLVVTLWYRSIEVLLGSESYDESIDMWSIGCIIGEMMKGTAILPGEGEIDQLSKIFDLLGYPHDVDFDGLDVPHYRNIKKNGNEGRFDEYFKDCDRELVELMKNLLCFDPRTRYSAEEVSSALFNRICHDDEDLIVEWMEREV